MANRMSDTVEREPHQLRLTPTSLIIALLGIQGGLLLSERFQWFAFNQEKGWTVLIAMAVAGLGVLALLIVSFASYLFKWQFQFSVKSLVLLLLVSAIPCCWFAEKRRQASSQLEASGIPRNYPIRFRDVI